MALMSGKVYSDAGTPSNATGNDGDIFMQLDGLKTTYRKEGGAWTPIGNQLGTIPEFLKGIGAPSNAVGEDGQYYREVNTDAIYQKDAGVWTNIGSWTSLEIQQLLLSNGIGADLSVTNHVSNIDAFTEAGAEGYFDNTTTGTKPDTYGLVKVWRESSTYIYQKAQTSNNKWATRYSSDGATTWLAWRVTANEDGDANRKFKALTGVAADDVAVVDQLPDPNDLLQIGGTIRSVYAEATGVSLSGTPADIVSATISCSAGVAIKFRVTAKIPFSVNSGNDTYATFILNNVTDGVNIDSSYHWDRDMSNAGMTGISTLHREVNLTPAGTTTQFKVQGTTNVAGTAGPTWSSVASQCTILVEVIKT